MQSPTCWNFHYLAHLYTLKSRWNIALQAIDQAIELEPERAMHHHVRGQCSQVAEAGRGARLAGNGQFRYFNDALPWHFHLSVTSTPCWAIGPPPCRALGKRRLPSNQTTNCIGRPCANCCRRRLPAEDGAALLRRIKAQTRQVRQRKQYNRRADRSPV